jgi:hypothetical protein
MRLLFGKRELQMNRLLDKKNHYTVSLPVERDEALEELKPHTSLLLGLLFKNDVSRKVLVSARSLTLRYRG